MWTFQPLVPNIHLPTDEDAQEDIRASIFCLLYSLWSQWEKNFYSKSNNLTFLWRLLCLVWFSSFLNPLSASLLFMEMQKQPPEKEGKKIFDIYENPSFSLLVFTFHLSWCFKIASGSGRLKQLSTCQPLQKSCSSPALLALTWNVCSFLLVNRLSCWMAPELFWTL